MLYVDRKLRERHQLRESQQLWRQQLLKRVRHRYLLVHEVCPIRIRQIQTARDVDLHIEPVRLVLQLLNHDQHQVVGGDDPSWC